MLARKFSRDTLAVMAKPTRRLRVVKDEADNRILECAVAGRADAIVTGDQGLLGLREYRGIRLLSLRDYIAQPG